MLSDLGHYDLPVPIQDSKGAPHLHKALSTCDVLSVQVIAVGSGKESEDGKIVKPNLNKGDTVLYSRYSGTEFSGQDDKQYIVIRESDVLASLA